MADRLNALLVDTAGPVVGVARLGSAPLLRTARLTRGADGWLAPQIAELADAPLDVVAVVTGPGAFTGLRVGIAAALGLALARGLPVVALSSLAVRSMLAPGEARLLVLLDAKKGRVYRAEYDTRGAVPILLGEEADLPPIFGDSGGVAVGEGAVAYAAALDTAGYRVAEDAAALPLDRCAALIAAAPRVDPALLGPRYLRDADAHKPAAVAGPIL